MKIVSRAGKTIGVDIGNESIKVICLENGGDRPKLAGLGYYAHQGAKDKLATFIADSELPKGELRLNVEDSSLKIRRLDLPEMPDDELGEAVKWGLKDYLTGDLDDYAFQFIKIDKADLDVKGKVPLVAFAINQASIDARMQFIESVGLKDPAVMEPDAGALASIFYHNRGDLIESCEVVIDLGRHAALFAMMGKKSLLFSRPLAGCGGKDLIDQISRDLAVTVEEATAIKLNFMRGVDTGLEEEKFNRLKNTVSHFFTHVSQNIQRSVSGYLLSFGKRQITNVFLCGEGAYLPGVAEFLQSNLGFSVSVLNPFEKIDTEDFAAGIYKGREALFAIACGLALN